MASINEVTIDLKFTGLDNLEQATKKMRQVQTEVKRLAKEEKAGAIDTGQYATRVGDLAAELQKVTGKHKQTADAVFAYSRAVKSSIAESERQKAVLAENAKFQKSLTEAKKVAASVSALNKQRIAEENAMLKQAQPAMEAYNRSLLGTDKAVKSARVSADVFAADIKRQETALKQAQPAMEAYNRSLLGTDRAVKSAKASADAFKPMLDALDQDAKMAAQAAEEYNRALLGTDKAQKSARASADVFKEAIKANELATEQSAQATREAAAADAALQAEKDRLIQKLNPLRSASMLYEKELNDINEATRLGVINDRQRQQSLDALNAEFQAYNAGVQGAAMANNRFAVQGQQAKRQTNQLGVLLQQTGYQVGDFAVQVQSGTNVMVALGQQATQLVGTFGMLSKSTRMIGLFAVLGVVIPILTAIAGAFMRVNETAQKTEDIISELSAAVSSYSSAVDILNMSQSELNDEFGVFSGYAVKAAQALKEIALTEINNQIKSLSNNLTDVSNLMGQRIPSNVNQTVREFLELNQGIRRNNEIVAEFINAQIALNQAEGPKAQAEALQNLMSMFESIVGTYGDMNGEQQKYYDSLRAALEEVSKFGSEEAKALAERDEARLKSAEKLAEAERLLGEQAQEAMRRAALERYKAERKMFADTEQNILDMIEVFRAAQKRMRDEEIAETERSLDRLFRNRTVMYNIRFAGEEAVMAQPVIQPPSAPAPPSYEEAMDLGLTREQMEILKVDMPRKSSGGGGGAGVDPTEEFNRAKAAVDQLVASYDEQYAMSLKVEEATRKIEEAQRLDAIPRNMEADQILRDYIASLEDAESPMLDLANTMSDALGDALMSVVDGTKSASDAFSDMARIIIKKAFEMAVINPILNSIFGTGGLNVSGYTNAPTLFANGAAFSGGNVIPFANGGVVGGPTTFPMANGKTGLMGEAGPEAIMPLKRGKDGKLGVTAEGGGNVVIHQTFQFSANGDDSVKRIIAQEAPRIANLTQKQIMDQRRRGGAMKATFG